MRAAMVAPANGDPAASEDRIRTGELKFVTLLRSDLVRSTDLVAGLGPEASMMRLEPALAAMRAAVRRYRGMVCREMGDGILAVFGAPLALDSHASFALHAAFAVVRQIAALGDAAIQVRVGVHSDSVVAYVAAGEYSTVFDLGGAALHLVDRIQSAAEPGHILVSEACQQLTDGFAQFELQPARNLKGYASPVQLFRAIAVGDPSRWQWREARSASPFVGRSDEMALLLAAMRMASAGRGRTIALLGEPGIGKSRLTDEFVRQLATDGWRVAHAECSPILQGSPYRTLKAVVSAVLEAALATDNGADPRAGLGALWRTALDAVLDRPIADPAWARLEPKARGRAIADACAAFIERATRAAPTVLVIEDAHWMDDPSAAVLERLGLEPNDHARLILATSRADGVPAWLVRCAHETIRLQPLSAQAATQMLDALIAGSTAPADLRSRLLQHTGSVPLFIEEVCRQLADGRVFAEAASASSLGIAFDDLRVPPTVQGVIAGRIDRLDLQQRALLQAAAALGPRCATRTLALVAGLPLDALRLNLQALDDAALLVDASSAAEPALRFPHDLVRQVAYESMLQTRRAQLHDRILRTLEADDGSAPADDRSDILCHHALLGKQWTEAFGYARAIARKCAARSALPEAIRHIEIAMHALDQEPLSDRREQDAADIRIESRTVFAGHGHVERWMDLARQAEVRARAIGDGPRVVAAMAVRAGAFNFYGTPLQAVAEGEEVLRQARALNDPSWLSFAEYGLGQAHFIAGRCREAEQWLRRACDRMSAPDAKAAIGTTPGSTLLLCYVMKAAAHVGLGEFGQAERCELRAHEIAVRTQRPFDAIAVGYSTGLRRAGEGDFGRARDTLQQALALAEQHEIRLFVPVVACHLGIACLCDDRLAEATELLARARNEAISVGHTSVILRASVHLACAIGLSGERLAALRTARGTRNAARRQGFDGIVAEALFAEAQILMTTPQRLRASIDARLAACESMARRLEARGLLARLQTLRGQIDAEPAAVGSQREPGSRGARGDVREFMSAPEGAKRGERDGKAKDDDGGQGPSEGRRRRRWKDQFVHGPEIPHHSVRDHRQFVLQPGREHDRERQAVDQAGGWCCVPAHDEVGRLPADPGDGPGQNLAAGYERDDVEEGLGRRARESGNADECADVAQEHEGGAGFQVRPAR
jgi:class 3 adenylate cyclase/tetratricopeptide (TPR) repeat protein